MPRKPPLVGYRRWLTEVDRDIAEEDARELARAEADYERWLSKARPAEGYDAELHRDDPNDFDSRDLDDLTDREGGRR